MRGRGGGEPFGRRVALTIIVLALLGLAIGCSSGGGTTAQPSATTSTAPPVPAGFGPAGAAVQGTASPDGTIRVDVPEVGSVTGTAGSVSTDAVLWVTPVTVRNAPAEVDGAPIEQVGTGLLVQVQQGRIQRPLAVRFPGATMAGGAGSADAGSVVGVHVADDGQATLLPSSLGPDGLTVVTDQFSVVGWVKTKLLKPIADFMAAKLAGRTTPPSCEDAPSWASVDGAASGSTHACVRAGKPLADGTPIAELEIKSNRGSYQWIELPGGVSREYVWVEDQSDAVRGLVKKVFGRGDTILLGPGKRMTVGYRQPVSATQIGFRSSVDNAALLMTVGHLAVDSMTDEIIDEIGGYLAVATCFGIAKVDFMNPDSPVQIQQPSVWTDFFPCVVHQVEKFAADPKTAVAAAHDLLGDEVSGETLTALSQKLFKIGKLAKTITKVLELGSYILKELAFVTDAVVGEFGMNNASTVTLSLMALPPKTTTTTSTTAPKAGSSPFYDTWRVHGSSVEFRPDGTGTDHIHDGFTDDEKWIDIVLQLSTSLSADGKTLTIEVTKVGFEVDGKPVAKNPTKYPPPFSVGDTFSAAILRPGLIEVTVVNTDTPTSLGNPYLCGAGISQADERLCGA